MHAIGGCAGDEIDAGLSFEYAERHVQGQRIARPAAVAIRGHHRDFGKGEKGLPEAPDALRTEAVVVADQDFQAVKVFKCIEANIARGLEPIKGASLYCFVSFPRRSSEAEAQRG
jgi:hypothetical protein